MTKKHLSVVIPARDEAENLGTLIPYLLQTAGCPIEIVVATSGQQDIVKLKTFPEVIIAGGGHRSLALNNGAGAASTDILYFLHADSYPPKNWARQILRQINKGALIGTFRMQFDTPNLMLRTFCWFTRFRWVWIRFGDQSLYIKKQLFEKIGGYNEALKIMEDTNIVERAKKFASINVLPTLVTTSARKYKIHGYYRLQLFYILIVVLYHCGVRQKKLLSVAGRIHRDNDPRKTGDRSRRR